ncbi:MAG: ABC transporter substrate-binding protein [Clostridiales bacterium]|uniref:ABC transporter substrate-binding protein n=1 Tax=Provencibacterium massiliense TaxID=1841868 RepID=UPI0009A80684|nr:ABC transporter substrate-binding protein [Provencibacterium massiliense]PWM39979.1 MAG: ABC transporter substrate-binding protein [Clostridiales bacterium]RGB69725.1 ABC transporter substrate-binding protein [Harryflintia acetispora]
MKKGFILLLSALSLLLPLSGCSGKADTGVLNIAEQFGIAYAPLQIMKEQHLLEERLPGVQVNWKQFGGPTAIREGMLAGEVDFGFMGPAPVLMGIDNGMEWKYATGISFNEMAIVVNRPEIQSLRDFTPEDRIAVLSPACTQHVLLCMAAEQEFGDPGYFDNQLVSLSHPDAMNALMSGTEVSAHVATPPYIGMELDEGMHAILTGEEIMGGPFTFITGVAMERFYDERPEQYKAFIAALDEAIAFINDNMDEAVRLLAPVYGIPEDELKAQMTYNGTIYSNRLEGIEKLSDAMQRMGFTKESPRFEDIVFPNVNR